MPENGLGSTQINFRASELEGDLQSRAGVGLSLHLVAKRDLERLYRAYDRTLREIRLSEAQASAIVSALWSTIMLDSAAPFYLDHEVADAVRLERIDQQWDIDGDELVRLVRDWTPFERLAVSDAVERAKLLLSGPEPLSLAEVVRSVGLVRG